MPRTLTTTVASLIIVFLLFETPARSADNRSVERRDADLAASWNRGDVQAMVEFWLPHGSYTGIGGSYAQGLSEIERALSASHAQLPKSHLASFVERTYIASPDSTIVIGTRALTFRDASNGQEKNLIVPYITIWKKSENRWKILADHWFVPRFGLSSQAELFPGSATSTALAARDRSTVETEIAASAMSKVAEWVKLLGFFVLAPLALALGLLGFKSYSDVRKFSKRLQHEQSEALQKIREQQEGLNQASLLVQKLTAEISERRAQLEEASKVLPELRALGSKVERLEKVVEFKPSPILTPEVQLKLGAAVHRFKKYFESLGFHSPQKAPEVVVDPKLEHAPYYAGSQIVIPSSMAIDDDAILRLYVHHVLTSALTLKQHQSGLLSVQYALASYFPSSFKNEPITDQRRFVEPPLDKEYDPAIAMDAGSALSGAFWELREVLGSDEADTLLFSAWTGLKPTKRKVRHPVYFLETLLDKTRSIRNGERVAQIRALFQKHGIELPQ